MSRARAYAILKFMKYLHALNCISGIGSKKLQMLLNYFPSAEEAWKGSLSSLQLSGIGEKTAEKLFWERNNINPDQEWEKLEKENIKILTNDLTDYPTLLKEIPNPPYILYYKGNSSFFNSFPCIAIVGSRKFSPYGRQAAEYLSTELAKAGVTIVSGMALGIDTYSHQGALAVDGRTIAVLGNGLDEESIYPRANFNLSLEIRDKGTLLSEYPPGTSAGLLTFPARNRIIAGISLGTLVVEAAENSGALITAQMALDFNREVFSVPGSIFSSSSLGTNNLIKKGAKTVSNIKDILEELDLINIHKEKESPPRVPENKEEEILLKVLSNEPLNIDKLTKLTKLKTSTVNSTLLMMELKGWVKNIGGQNYILL